MIIEFVGPPGAGKTTCCRAFAEDLKGDGKVVFTLPDLKSYLRKLSVFQKMMLVVKGLLQRVPLFLNYVMTLGRNGVLNKNSLYRFTRLSLFDLALKKYIRSNKVDVVLLEQWMIQELWSATIFKLSDYSKIATRLSKFYFITDYLFYFDIDEVTAAKRISHRQTNLSRFDRLEPAIRVSEIKKYSSYLFQLFEHSQCPHKYLLSADQSIQKNTVIFNKCLETNFNNSLQREVV